MKIKEPDLRWNGVLVPLDPRNVLGTVIHHMAHQSWTFMDVHNAHLKNGWTGIGYNFWIALDGTIYKGRGFYQGAHVANLNSKYIGIGLQGDFHNGTQKPTQAQLNAAVWLINNVLYPKFHRAKNIFGHGDLMPTACPGKRFPMAEFKKMVAENKIILEKGDEKLKLSNYQWSVLEKNVNELLQDKVITDQSWLTKVKNKTLTVSELAWLNNVIAMRLKK